MPQPAEAVTGLKMQLTSMAMTATGMTRANRKSELFRKIEPSAPALMSPARPHQSGVRQDHGDKDDRRDDQFGNGGVLPGRGARVAAIRSKARAVIERPMNARRIGLSTNRARTAANRFTPAAT